ncbi:MAG: D-tyrosyl-tRNA(Tyr) deacylase [Dehalococcoidia bacterium]|nr:D-tyrosyl-tRNA(Tyr) deacylase [Dehalococcoidia bacterium]
MRALIQRVTRASVTVNGAPIGAINRGLLVLLAVGQGDTEEDARYIVDKTVNLRIFPVAEDRFDRSVLDEHLDVLVVSQFTLYADTRHGRRPGFSNAAPPDQARTMFDHTVDLFQQTGLLVATGQFAEHMLINLVNDGPVTIWLDSTERHTPRNR